MTSSFELTLLSRKIYITFPNIGNRKHKVEIQWTPGVSTYTMINKNAFDSNANHPR